MFEDWQHDSLVKFAVESSERLAQQTREIEALKRDLRVALEAYRNEVQKNHAGSVRPVHG